MSDEDEWDHLTRGIARLPSKAVLPKPAPRAVFTRHPYGKRGLVPGKSVNSTLTVGTTTGIDKGTAQKLKDGKFIIDARLDLHGLTIDKARLAVRRLIISAYDQQQRCVLIITGKGDILRAALPDWLNEPDMRQRLLALHHARPNDGGDGAFYVLIRRQRG